MAENARVVENGDWKISGQFISTTSQTVLGAIIQQTEWTWS